MTEILKNILKRFFSLFGYGFKGITKTIKHNNFDAIHKFLVNNFLNKEKITIFDVGANAGDSIERFKNIFQNYSIYSFEPIPEIFKKLEKNYSKDKNNNLYNLALSNSTEKKNFYIYGHNKISSFLKIKKDSKFEISRKFYPDVDRNNWERKIQISCNTLDKFVEENSIHQIDILKIDTQGFEPEILQGADNFLKNNKISIIELELIIGIAYEKNSSFYEVEKFLNNSGYKLIAISEGGNILSYSSYQVDCIYVNNKIFNAIEKMHFDNISIKDVTKKVDKSNPKTY